MGEPLVAIIADHLAKLETKFRSTNYLQDVVTRFNRLKDSSLEAWAKTAAQPIEQLLSSLAKTRTDKEGEPMITKIEEKFANLPKKFIWTLYYKRLRTRSWEQRIRSRNNWARTAAKPVEDALMEIRASLDAAVTAEECERLFIEAERQLSQLPKKFDEMRHIQNLRYISHPKRLSTRCFVLLFAEDRQNQKTP